MPSLPQMDPSPTRVAELEEVRSRYVWNHEELKPFSLLEIDRGRGTGILDMGSLLKGFYVGLPEEERASEEWLMAKALAALPPMTGLLEDVSAAEYLKLVADVNAGVNRTLNDWLATARAGVDEQMDARAELRAFLPRVDYLGDLLMDVGLDVVGDVGVMTDDGDSVVGNLIRVLQAVFNATPEVDAMPTSELLRVMRRAGAPSSALQTVSLLQSLARFIGRKGTDNAGAVQSMCETLKVSTPPMDDRHFGWRVLGGPNPVVVRRLKNSDEIPAHFPVDNRHLAEAMRAIGLPEVECRSASLSDLAASGALFLCDYAIIDKLTCAHTRDRDFTGQLTKDKTDKQRWLPAPLGLFLRVGDELRAIAVQLGQDPNVHAIYTPADEAELWLKVKTLYLVGDLNHHESITHLHGAHLLLEPFAVSAARQLHRDHPIAVVLRPHLHNVLWNNFLGKQILLNPEGFMDQIMSGELDLGSFELMRRKHEVWTFSELIFPDELASRGVDDPELLPVYPYRDDGLPLWEALRAWVGQFLGLHYTSAEDVRADTELAAWLEELAASDGGQVVGLPEVDGIEPLIDIVTGLIFRSGPYHSAVNYPQGDFFTDPNQVPAAAWADPAKVRETPLEDYLPPIEPGITQAAVMYILASIRHITFADFDFSLFDDPDVWPLVADLRVRLDELEAEIMRRDVSRPVSYPYLRPSLVSLAANV